MREEFTPLDGYMSSMHYTIKNFRGFLEEVHSLNGQRAGPNKTGNNNIYDTALKQFCASL